jgi:hypothetical protein
MRPSRNWPTTHGPGSIQPITAQLKDASRRFRDNWRLKIHGERTRLCINLRSLIQLSLDTSAYIHPAAGCPPLFLRHNRCPLSIGQPEKKNDVEALLQRDFCDSWRGIITRLSGPAPLSLDFIVLTISSLCRPQRYSKLHIIDHHIETPGRDSRHPV